jgi:Cu2+-exporting ATPase
MSNTVDFSCFTHEEADRLSLYLQVEGMRCASCAWKIEQSLRAHEGVEARINFSTQRLRLTWPNGKNKEARSAANAFAAEIETLGFHVAPFDPDGRAEAERAEERELMSCLAVAGFATLAVMLFVDPLWFLPKEAVEGPTRDLMHWVMGLIAMPATLYCGRPFFRSAVGALSHRRMNMDVPISLAVLLANGMSLFETIRHGPYVYFDASVMLLFFLLIGRYLDQKARGKARETAMSLLAMLEGTAKVLRMGQTQAVRIRDIIPGEILLVAAGEKIAADGTITKGTSDIDTRLVTGESLPRSLNVSDRVYAGMINMSAPIEVKVSAAADESLLSEMVGLMEKAEQSQSPYVRLADRIAGIYAPAVHILALATFIGWMMFGFVTHRPVAWEDALLKAVAVLIITCPCALGLAVPVAHVMASSQLFSRGILLKSGKAIEALARVDTVIFDKTGTLTTGEPTWLNPSALTGADLDIARAMAAHSRHPLSQAIAGDKAPEIPDLVVEEVSGQGLLGKIGPDIYRMGRATWVGANGSGDGMELWFQSIRAGSSLPPIRLDFKDAERTDAREVVTRLRAMGLQVVMLSGDRAAIAEATAASLGIKDAYGEMSPVEKVEIIRRYEARGMKVLMVGDGLNDAAALTAASVSMSPSSAVDITQNAADLVYRGKALSPVATAIQVARDTQTIVKQNFAISLGYNVLAVPAAILGFATPLLAAIAMSSSSLIVVLNALRLKLKVRKA